MARKTAEFKQSLREFESTVRMKAGIDNDWMWKHYQGHTFLLCHFKLNKWVEISERVYFALCELSRPSQVNFWKSLAIALRRASDELIISDDCGVSLESPPSRIVIVDGKLRVGPNYAWGPSDLHVVFHARLGTNERDARTYINIGEVRISKLEPVVWTLYKPEQLENTLWL